MLSPRLFYFENKAPSQAMEVSCFFSTLYIILIFTNYFTNYFIIFIRDYDDYFGPRGKAGSASSQGGGGPLTTGIILICFKQLTQIKPLLILIQIFKQIKLFNLDKFNFKSHMLFYLFLLIDILKRMQTFLFYLI